MSITKKTIRDWVEELPKKGIMTFNIEQVRTLFTNLKEQSIVNALYRLGRKGKILSVWKGFYVVIPVEYALSKQVPPYLYIDELMDYLERNYYIGLLSAASFYGAAHQRPQTFSVLTELPPLRTTLKNNVQIVFPVKRSITEELWTLHKTQSGYVKVSTPEVTALDLLIYENEIGGLNRATEVIQELCAEMDFKGMSNTLLSQFPIASIQRLGYILSILEEKKLAEIVWEKAQEVGLTFWKTPLKTGKEVHDTDDYHPIWKIIINEQIYIDE